MDICRVISSKTILVPLQNGIYAYDYLLKKFPNNKCLRRYIQGPNTVISENDVTYKNSGALHIGSDNNIKKVEEFEMYFRKASISLKLEKDIEHLVLKKWMLNVTGNYLTALTGTDYSLFQHSEDLRILSRKIMKEFIMIAELREIYLTERDIEDIIDYYTSYPHEKKTSMLVDVIQRKKTENEYIAGYALAIARENLLQTPLIEALFMLISIKESTYL